METLGQVELSNLIASAALLAVVVGLCFTALQIRRSNATQRGMFFRQLYEPFFLDDAMRYVFDLIEKKEDIFRPDFGATNTREAQQRQRAIERVFAHFEIICSLYQRGLLADEDMRHFNYNIQRLFNYPRFHDYEAMLDSWWKSKGLERGPYSSFFWYTNANSKRLTISTPITP